MMSTAEPSELWLVPRRFSAELAAAVQVWSHQREGRNITRADIVYELEVLGGFEPGTISIAIDRMVRFSPLQDRMFERGKGRGMVAYEEDYEIKVIERKRRLMEALFKSMRELPLEIIRTPDERTWSATLDGATIYLNNLGRK